MKTSAQYLSFAFVMTLFSSTVLAAGGLDTTFNGSGKKTFDLGGNEDVGNVIQQSDGKLVIAGEKVNSATGVSDIYVLRMTDSGALDTTFNGSGKKVFDLGQDEHAYALIQQADGKLVIAGYKYDLVTCLGDIVVMRLNANGSLDTTFNGTGKKILDLGADERAYALAQQSDGKLVVAGLKHADPAGDDMVVLRLNTNGNLDTTFNGNGKKLIDLGKNDLAFSLALQKDGKLVIAGQSGDDPKGISDMAIVRLNANGALDTTFNASGKKILDLGAYDMGISVIVQSDGKLVVAGEKDGSSQDMVVVRLNASGSLDTTFNGTGKKVMDMGADEFGYRVLQQDDGKLLVAGGKKVPATDDFLVVRLTSTGAFDTTFNNTGKSVIDLGGNEVANAMVIQADGKLVVAGQKSSPTSGADNIAVVRLKL